MLTSPRATLSLVGAAGISIGTATLVAPGLCMRLLGLEDQPRSTAFLSGLYGGRDLVLGGALLAAARREDIDPSWFDLVTAAQISDIALTWRLWRRGRLSRRAALVVLASAPATAVLCVAARRRLTQTAR